MNTHCLPTFAPGISLDFALRLKVSAFILRNPAASLRSNV
jgi:hypothetical protein